MLNNEFNTLCEDGSLEEVGEKLCRYFQLIQTGREQEVSNELQTFKGSGVQNCRTQELPKQNDEAESSTPMDTDSADTPRHSRNEPDEDGWITVTKGKK